MITLTEKRCPTCGETKPISEFNKNRARKDGLSSHCKLCKYANCKRLREELPHRNTWHAMIHRCENPKCHAYPNYGGRGISVCESWHIFENFKRDMGPRPDGMCIDRIDNDKGYCKDNCEWVTVLASNRNKGDTKLSMEKARIIRVDYKNGRTQRQLAREYGVTDSTIHHVLINKTWQETPHERQQAETQAYRKVEQV